MNRLQAITAMTAFALLASITVPSAWATEPASPPAATKDSASPPQPAEVQKTKTKSNQSNDRAASPPPAADPSVPAKPDEVLKSKTKSNQSND